MTTTVPAPAVPSLRTAKVDVDVVVPVFDEQAVLATSVRRLHALTDPGRGLEVTVLVLANLAATLLRFVVLRTVVTLAPEATR